MSDLKAAYDEIMGYDEADVALSPVPFLHAVKTALELHKPERFGGVTACLACSPGMPPPLLVEWKDCGTVREITRALGVRR